MAQLRALSALVGDPGLVSMPYTGSQPSTTSVSEHLIPFSDFNVDFKYMVHTHKNIKNNF